jgi:secreted trypsin-like serine protease
MSTRRHIYGEAGMFLRIDPRRADRRTLAPRVSWLVVTALFTLLFTLLGTSTASAAIPSRPGPEGLPAGPSPDSRVVGGTPVPDGRYPFQAALLIQFAGQNDHQRQFCGGSLITRWQVLTAAHCVDFFGPRPDQLPVSELRVVVGRTVLTSTQGQRRSVVGIAVHPRWNPATFRNDAAVITLNRPITGIRPIQVVTPGVDALERPGRSVIATGWGNTIVQPVGPGAGGAQYPDRMREVTVPIVSPPECATAYLIDGMQFLDRNTMLCAGRRGKDTCQGDSGGPLFVRAATGGYIQIGITSWGIGCGATGFPGVYTKLSNLGIGNFIQVAAGGIPV